MLHADVIALWRKSVKIQKCTKGVIRSRASKKDRQYNGREKNDKRRYNDNQNITQKTKDRSIQTPLKTGGERRCSGRISSSCSTCITHERKII